MDIRDKLSEAHQAVIDIRAMQEDLDYLKKKLKSYKNTEEIVTLIDALDEEMTIIENNIHETRNEARQDPLNFGIKLNNRLAYLASHESSGDYRPTDQGVAYKEEVSAQIDAQLSDLSVLWNEKLPHINTSIREANIEFIAPVSMRGKTVKP